MPLKDTGTERLIKDAAKRLLFAEGKLYATTQDIADAAGINRSAVHYYYRTRNQLISQVFEESMTALSLRLDQAMLSDHPFPKKIEELIDIYLAEMIAYPYEETFMVTEINNAGHKLVTKIKEGPVSSFLEEVAREMEAGTIDKMNPVHFLINLFSLLSYPIIMAPLYQQFFQLAKDDFNKIIQERRDLVYQMIFKTKDGKTDHVKM
ncbi:TetR/AcrR family transcriptional regulator [Mucilaginibacter sp. BJC16-A38]|uniref:TetR/AcrR family transcriptional regulator n=1 Tax=Mucilaginibacter phenanthrenivorans TaxID=1234842 RepID=UPI0021573325|nr:TetR/AcrR family transcriptional regulator [Mucilaginibacter phenanthrenivorans]MCR8557319.1 TetR/AcrR family transcriptional regulator [Mucilaginibacter phenanthrenivorans]